MKKRTALLGIAAATSLVAGLLAPAAARAEGWKDQVKTFRVGVAGGENQADRLKNFSCFKDRLSQTLGVPVELNFASDYAGVMQGLLAGNLEAVSGLGASAYAGIVIDNPDAAEPIGTQEQTDGSTGYHSVVVVRADSPYRSVADLKGHSLAFADPNSSSGYLYPSFELKRLGYDPQAFFGSTGFAGGHEQGVIAVLTRQYDAAATWASMVGEESQGYTSGNLRKMVDKGALKMSDIRILWQSSLIPNAPELVRKSMPADLKAAYTRFFMELPKVDPDCFKAVEGGDFRGLVPVPAGFYDNVIELRREMSKSRRAS